VVRVGPGLGDDFDASISELVILRREWVLVMRIARMDDFGAADAGEAIDVDLPAVRAGRGTGKRLNSD